MTPLRSVSMCLVLALVGCSQGASFDGLPKTAAPSDMMAPAAASAKMQRNMPGESGGMGGGMNRAGASAMSSDNFSLATMVEGQTTIIKAVADPAGTAPTGIARKIIYDAQVELVVESVDPIAKKVGSLVQQARGYIAEQNVSGSPGSQRSMFWRFRIPVDQFDSFAEAVASLGELTRNNRTSQDVTDQFYDLDARIKNKKLEEQTLNKILQERSGKLEDVLKIEIELSRVRGEVEQLEGKIRVLENVSSLATLTLNVREREKYAPSPPIAADFRTKMARVWDGSLSDITKLAQSVLLWAISMVVWIPFLLIGTLIAWIVVRWLIRVCIRNLPRLLAAARTPITLPRASTPSE